MAGATCELIDGVFVFVRHDLAPRKKHNYPDSTNESVLPAWLGIHLKWTPPPRRHRYRHLCLR